MERGHNVLIDWLSLSGTVGSIMLFLEALELKGVAELGKDDGRKGRGYAYAMRYNSGATILYNDEPSPMGAHIAMSGQQLETVRAHGYDNYVILLHAKKFNLRPSRLDVALDLYNYNIPVRELGLPNNVDGMPTDRKARNMVEAVDGSGGETCYIGSRTSDVFGRVYNKAAQQEIVGDWVRIEAEFKDIRARWAMQAFISLSQVSHTDTEIAVFLLKEICKHPVLDEVDSNAHEIDAPFFGRTFEGNTEKWLYRNVRSAVINWAKRAGEEAATRFVATLATDIELLFKKTPPGGVAAELSEDAGDWRGPVA